MLNNTCLEDENLDERIVRRYTQIVVGGASFLTPFIGSSLNLAIPSIGVSFQASALMLSWVMTSYLLTTVSLLVPFGSLADIIGRKRIFTIGLTIFTCSAFLGAISWSMETMIVFRVLQGLGCAMIFGTGIAMLTSTFPPQERGKVLGTNVAMVYLGLTLGPFLGGFLNHHFGWHSIFLFCGIIALGVLILTIFKLRDTGPGEKSSASFDTAGALLYMAGVSSFLYGLSSLSSYHFAWFIVIAGLVILGVFVRHELGAVNPVFPLGLFKHNRTFTYANLAALINYCATFALSFLISLYLQTVLHYDSQTAGFILLTQALVMAAVSPFAGRLSDRVHPATVAVWGMGIATLGVFIFAFIGYSMPIWVIIANLMMLGFGFAIFSSPNTNMVMGSVEKRFLGIASATLGTMRMAGQTVSMAMVTLILGWFIGHVELAKAAPDLLIKGIRVSFLVYTVISIFGIVALLRCKKAGDD